MHEAVYLFLVSLVFGQGFCFTYINGVGFVPSRLRVARMIHSLFDSIILNCESGLFNIEPVSAWGTRRGVTKKNPELPKFVAERKLKIH